MKGILEFNLPGEEEEFRVAQDGGAWKSVVQDLSEKLRGWLKYGLDNRELTEQEFEIVERTRSLIYDMVNEKELSIE